MNNLTDKPYIISWSGGKDSTASIVLARKHQIPIAEIIMSLIWFNKDKKIYAEYPEVVEWVLNYAKPLFESWGYKVKILESERDYDYYFHHIITGSKHPERNGKKAAFLIGGKCYMNREKINPIKKYLKTLGGNYTQIVGIAADETSRLKTAHKKGQISLLEKYGISEQDTYEILKPYGLLSPTYSYSTRGGCWFCPNQRIKELAHLKTMHPELWSELAAFDNEPNKVSEGFKYGETFKEISIKVDKYITNPPAEQLSIFDYF